MSARIRLSVLTAQTEQALELVDISDKTKMNYHYEGFGQIRRHYETCGLKYYSDKETRRSVLESRQRFESGNIGRARFTNIRKAAVMLEEFRCTGKITWHRLRGRNYVPLRDKFEKLLSDYAGSMKASGAYSSNSIMGYKGDAYHLLAYLEQKGHSTLAKISLKEINGFIPVIAKTHPVSMGRLLNALRSFAAYLNNTDQSPIDMLPALHGTPAKHRRVIPGFTQEEADAIVNAIDTDTVLGKRDYAMLLLAKNTSLRAVDIGNLKLDELDWRTNEIKLSQSKTGIPLILPLEPDVGNAIADYILNARPPTNLPFVFLRTVRPYTQLNPSSLNTIVTRYMDSCGVKHAPGEWRGTHSFRRSLGARMLETGTPLSVISNVLGHTNMDSTRPYLSTNLTQLRVCALGLEGIQVEQENLL